MRKIAVAVLGCALTSAVCLADANVEQKTQVHFGGVVGGIINVFGGKATREGLTSTTVVKGNRKLTTTGTSSGEIVDLGEEKIYHLDFDRKTYKVVTFDELRKQFEEQKERAAKDESRSTGKKEGPEYEVDVDVKETGQRQEINGFNTKQVIVTVTTHEKGKKLEQSGGVVLTSDMWMGPRIAAMKEIADFDRRYFEKLYGSTFGAAEMQQMAVLMATNPAFGKAMKTFASKKSSLDGTAIKTTLTVEAVASADQKASEGESDPSLSAASAIGGLLKRAQARRQEKSGAEPGRSRLMDSTVEVMKATGSASSSDVALPAGFKERR